MLLAAAGLAHAAAPAPSPSPKPGKAQERSVYDFKVETIDGKQQDLSAYKGQALLVVNTASECGYTPQYKGLEELYRAYKARGFTVLAFPANNFGGQEPGSNAEIKRFCELKYRTTFPLFGKVSVKGQDIHPLFQHLTQQPGLEGDIRWNFSKFLIDPSGKLVARFDSKVEPMSPELRQKLEATLP
ncbi:glutathione peroxidase [Aggregicoccus sp. 17bor-14]|nr:glutathione peroxidase [Aggregicoccus sp. 17bor-14]